MCVFLVWKYNWLYHFFWIPHICIDILGWSKSSFRFFHKMLWKTQINLLVHPVRCLFLCLWLTSLCVTVYSPIHMSANGTVLFLFMWSNIPLHVFIHSSAGIFWSVPCPGYCKYCCNEHLGAWIFWNYDFLWGVWSGVRLLNHLVVLNLLFKGTSMLISIAIVLISIPNSVIVFCFLHTLSSIYCL